MDRASPAAVATPRPVRADIAELERILRERDESVAEERANRNSGPGLPFSADHCGCTERTDCDWHAHVAEALDDARTIITSYDTIGPFRWSAMKKDACGCPECHPPIGRGQTEEAALKDFYEQEELRAEVA